MLEALTKSGMLWVQTPERAWPVWHVYVDGTVYVMSGEGEQPLPPLPETVTLILRSKESRARLLTVAAVVRQVHPQDEGWDSAATALKAARLNAPGAPPMEEQWATGVTVTALTPVLDEAVIGAIDEESSGAAPPAPTPATTRRDAGA